MISVFSKTAKTEKELAGVGYPILDRWAKSATLKAALNGKQYITVTIPHKAEGVKRNLIPSEFDILKIQDMEDEDDYYRIGKPRYTLNSTILTAEHISYDLIDNIIEDINIIGLDGQQAMDRISQGTQYSHPFLLRSNIRHTANIRMVRMNPMQALIGNADNTFISRYGGELRRRRFTLTINDRVGMDRTEVIRSKKNLNGFERDIDIDSIVTRIMPKAENGILLPEKYVDSPIIGNYPHPKIRVIEYKTGYQGEFKDLPDNEKQAVYQKLRQFAKAEFQTGIDKPKATYKISFVPLSKTKEYESYRFMEAINLGDKVGVYEESYDIYIEARVVEVEWDILNKKYISLTLGSFQESLAKSSVSQNSSIASQIQDAKETANLAMASADGKTTNFYGFDEPSNPRLGDTWFKRNGEETEIWQYEEVDGVPMWIYKVGPQHAKDIEQRINNQLQSVTTQMAENEAELAEFREEIKSFDFSPEKIEELNTQFDDIKSDIGKLSETDRLTAEIIGNDGVTRYNKNLLMGGTERTQAFDGPPIEIQANDGGFKAGVTYTISFESLCELLQQLSVSFEQTHQKPWSIVLEPTNPRFSTETTTDTTVKVYPDDYRITIRSDWYETKVIETRLSEANSLIRPEMVYRSVADGNQDETMLGVWAERPDIIFDGGGS